MDGNHRDRCIVPRAFYVWRRKGGFPLPSTGPEKGLVSFGKGPENGVHTPSVVGAAVLIVMHLSTSNGLRKALLCPKRYLRGDRVQPEADHPR